MGTDYPEFTPVENAGFSRDIPNAYSSSETQRLPKLIRASDVKIEPISWLWEGWLPRGKLVLMAGMAGCGKTTLTMDMAARVSTGAVWPDGTKAQLGSVVIWSGEDGMADTLVPRLEAAGANKHKVHFVGGANEAMGDYFNPALDMPALKETIEKEGDVRLLILDPIVSVVTGDSHKNTEVRRNLQPVVDLARQTDICVIGISHFSKQSAGRNTTERVNGSNAFGAIARVVLAVAKDKEGGGVLLRAKSNLGKTGGGYRFTTQEIILQSKPNAKATKTVWGEPLSGSAEDVLATVEGCNESTSRIEEASNFLRDELAGGAMAQCRIEELATDLDISKATLKRAKNMLEIVSIKRPDGWFWELPSKMLKGK